MPSELILPIVAASLIGVAYLWRLAGPMARTERLARLTVRSRPDPSIHRMPTRTSRDV